MFLRHQKNSIDDISTNLVNILSDVNNITIIGHSLGGVIGFDLASKLRNKVKNLITISSPFSGLDLNLFIKSLLIIKIPFLVDIFKNSLYLKKLSKAYLFCRWTVIKTKGAGFGIFFNQENDGVLTYKDQQVKWFKQPRKEIDVEANHLEVLLNFDTVKIIKEILQK